MTRYQKIEQLVTRILALKQAEDLEHVRKAAKLGCHCPRCKVYRKIRLTDKKS